MGSGDDAGDGMGGRGSQDVIAVDLAPFVSGRRKAEVAAPVIELGTTLPFGRGEDGSVDPLVVVVELLVLGIGGPRGRSRLGVRGLREGNCEEKRAGSRKAEESVHRLV